MGVCKLAAIVGGTLGRGALEGNGRTSQRGDRRWESGVGKVRKGDPAVKALRHLLQLLSHQPSVGAERAVSKDKLTRKFLPSLALVASDAIGESGKGWQEGECVCVVL